MPPSSRTPVFALDAARGLGLALSAAVLLSALPAALAAATHHVAPPPLGDDANPGTESQPWATLQHAADSIAAGDTVVVRAGSYAGAHLTTSGSEALPIVWRAHPGETVDIVADNDTTPDGINLEGASWVTVEGFRIAGRTRAGIRAVLCQHVTIRGNVLDANGRWGVLTGFCDDLLIEGNVASNSVAEHGIYVGNSGDRPVIRDNLIVGNHANGIHLNGDASLGGDGVIDGAVIERNVIVDNGAGGGSGINGDGLQGSVIRNNLVYASHASGISLYRIDGGGPSSGNRVVHNTVLVAEDGRWALNVQDASTDNFVRNNVFYSSHPYRGAISVSVDSLPGLDCDHNAVEDRFTTDDGDSVMTLAQWRVATSQDADSLAVTPAGLFVDLAGDDHHPLPTGPLVDAGETVVDALEDLEGTPRPLRQGVDIGAYEWDPRLFWDAFESGVLERWTRRRPVP